MRVTRYGAVLAGLALLATAACEAAEAGDVEPLPPLERPTPEQRAGLPVLSGRWIFTGFEYPARDTLRVREFVYRLVPPGEFQVTAQRLDSIAGRYVRGGTAFPMVGEVRRDGIFSFVAFAPDGVGSFAAGHVVKDTLWMELTSFASAAEWPPQTRAAFVRRPRGAPFVRLRDYVPPPPDTARDEDEDEGGERPAPPPVSPEPRPAPPPVERPERPRPRPVEPPAPEPPAVDTPFGLPPQDTPQRPPPRRRRGQPRDTVRFPPPTEPAPFPPPPTPDRPAPRDTLRIPE
ncbi:MAG TPA: hypothetical protein VF746_10940 [Longimicrobium sp.]